MSLVGKRFEAALERGGLQLPAGAFAEEVVHAVDDRRTYDIMMKMVELMDGLCKIVQSVASDALHSVSSATLHGLQLRQARGPRR